MNRDEVREKVARAICRLSVQEGGCQECPLSVETAYGPGQQACIGIALDQADAAIGALLDAISEPSEGMVEAAQLTFWNAWPGFRTWWENRPDGHGGVQSFDSLPPEPFESALAAALKAELSPPSACPEE